MTDQTARTEYHIRRMNNAIEAAAEAKAKMTKDIADMGVSYAVKWADKSMKAEQEGRVAAEVLAMLEQGETMQAVYERMSSRAMAQLSYLIPSNSDIAEAIYFAQSYGRMAEIFRAEAA